MALPKITLTQEQKKQIGVGVIVGVAVLYFYYSMALKPVRADIVTRRDELNQLTAKLDQAKALASRRDALQKELNALQEEVKATETQLPRSKQLPDLLRLVTKTAAVYRITINRFEPKPAQASANGYFDEVPFGITLSGTYHDLARFMADMGQSVRIVTPERLQLTGKVGDKRITVDATLDLVAYTYKG